MTRIIETDESGALTIPPELLERRTAHDRYVVERNGAKLNIAPL